MVRVRIIVGAFVKNKENQFLLVRKVKMMNAKEGPKAITPRWDIPKGGVKKTDNSLLDAIMRELEEETGSREYSIIKEFKEGIYFELPQEAKKQLGVDSQELTLFFVNFEGDEKDLQPQDEEIDMLVFKEKEEFVKLLQFKDVKEFFIKNVQ